MKLRIGSGTMSEPWSLKSSYPITCQSCPPTTRLSSIPVTSITFIGKARCQNIDILNVALKIMTLN